MTDPHPATPFVRALLDLAEGRTAPADWLDWWRQNEPAVEAACSRGWYLRIKLRNPETAKPTHMMAWGAQQGAAYILDKLGVAYTLSDRYREVAQREQAEANERRDVQEKAKRKQLRQRLRALEPFAPRFAKRWHRKIDRVDVIEPPATPEEIAEAEANLGRPFPAALKRLFLATRTLQLDGIQLGVTRVWPHPTGHLCIGEYWLEADGDQILIPADTTSDDPPVLYYAQATGTARPLMPSFSQWLDSQ